MIRFKFNEKKTTQVASLFIKKEGGKINYMKLIKLLYLVDRDALLRWERPLTGDTYVSMKQGPVLSSVLDIINYGKAPVRIKNYHTYWYEYITEPKDFEIELVDDSNPGTGKLSEKELALIDEIFNEFGKFSKWELVDICHDILDEWEDPGKTSVQIYVDDIYKAENIPQEEIDRIDEEVSNINYAKELLSIED